MTVLFLYLLKKIPNHQKCYLLSKTVHGSDAALCPMACRCVHPARERLLLEWCTSAASRQRDMPRDDQSVRAARAVLWDDAQRRVHASAVLSARPPPLLPRSKHRPGDPQVGSGAFDRWKCSGGGRSERRSGFLLPTAGLLRCRACRFESALRLWDRMASTVHAWCL